MKYLQAARESDFGAAVWPVDPGWSVAHAGALAQTFAALAGDIVLVLDETGVILAAAQGEVPPEQGWVQGWVGRKWADTAAADTRGKVERMVQDLAMSGQTRKREVNHPANDGHALAIAWTAIRLGNHGPSLALGRDLAAAALQQQRLLKAQEQLEASYWTAREELS